MSGLTSPLILKYEKTLENNPKSRVFAPLAESYRKLGQIDRALEILKIGLRFHPTYILGHLGLAYCYFDIEEFNLAYTTLRPFIDDNKDNLRLMKLFAKICLKTKSDDEALETFKYLLFLNPRDKEVARNVKLLEDNLSASQVSISFKKESGETDSFTADTGFKVENLSTHPSKDASFDEWIQIDFKPEEENVDQVEIDQWNLKKNETLPPEETFVEDSRVYEVEEVDAKEETSSFENTDSPVITHTLVDLYCKQGHIQKACEILENILRLNPADQRTKEKLQEVMALLPIEEEPITDEFIDEPEHEETIEVHLTDSHKVLPFEQSEQESREHLMSYFENESESYNIQSDNEEIFTKVEELKISIKQIDNSAIEAKLWAFNKKIQERASRYLDHRT